MRKFVVIMLFISSSLFKTTFSYNLNTPTLAIGALSIAATTYAATELTQRVAIPLLTKRTVRKNKKKRRISELEQALQELPDHADDIDPGTEDQEYKNGLLNSLSELIVCKESGCSLNPEKLEQTVQKKLETASNPFKHAENLFFSSDYSQAKERYERLLPSVAASDNVMRRAHLNYGETLLGLGDYKNGFRELDRRLELRDPLEKPWDGSSPKGKTILVKAEQGLGDTFFFTSLLHGLKKLGTKKIILQVQRPLKSLMSSSPYVDQVVTSGDKFPKYDNSVYVMSLPRFLKKSSNNKINLGAIEDPDQLPIESTPHIIADPQLKNEWAEKFSQDKNIKIGICWRASKLPAGQTRYIKRDLALSQMIQALGTKGTTLYSLQGGGHRPITQQEYNKLKAAGTLGEIDEFDILPKNTPRIEEVKDTHGPFMDTAAAMENLDAVVSVDTSIPNLAGAMRRPTLLLLSKAADWRWLTERKDSPWQPTLKLLRQKQQGDWLPVLKELREKIDELRKNKAR